MKKKTNRIAFIISVLLMAGLLIVGVNFVVSAYSGGSPKVIVEGNYIEAPQVEPMIGASPGPEYYNTQYFKGGFGFGGSYASSSVISSSTLSNFALEETSYISWYPGKVGINTLVTPASSSVAANDMTYFSGAVSSTLDFIGNNTGDSRSWILFNATGTTVGANLYLQAGAGVDMQFAYDDATAAAGTGTSTIIYPGESAELTFIRKATTDFLLLVKKFAPAD